jgi:cytoskeleton protein RodZ
VLIFFPTSQRSDVVSEVTADSSASLPMPAAVPALAPLPVASEPFVDPAGRPAPALVAAAPVKPATPPPVVTPPVSAPVVAPAPMPVTSTSTGLVVFKLRGASWVEVTDASGVVQVRRIVSSGETVGASGVLPLTVVVGRADVTDVQVRGKPFDLVVVSKDNVARFEVK